MKLLNFTIIQLTFCFVLGIYIGYMFDITLPVCSVFISVSVLLLAFFYVTKRNQYTKSIGFGISAWVAMFFCGILVTNLHDEKNNSKHYTNQISVEKDSLKTITFRIREVLKPNTFYNKYIVDLLHVDGKNVTGKSLLNIQKDSLTKPLLVDAVFISKTAFQDISNSLNPHQFKYKLYLERKYIFHQLFTSEAQLFKVKSTTKTRFGVTNTIRNHINDKLKPYHFTPNELAIINALLLGQRQNISENVYTSYTNAGAIHILAISGLHIGIVLLILQYIFKPIERIKHGKLLNAVLLVSILWSFAIIAGLSASVTRAVTMFSVVAIAKNLNRPTNIYNTLAVSMLVILLFKPLFLFDIGFQLSYLAVISIVVLDPLLYKLWKPRYKIANIYWHTFTVTIAAQVGILPLSLYYFHQFPSLFFLTNLVIIPLLEIILGLGIAIMLLAVLNILPPFMATTYGHIISFMNSFVAWISEQNVFLFKDISFSLLYLFVFYLLLFSLVWWCKKQHFSALKWLLISVICVQIAVLFTSLKIPDNQFIIFQKNRFTLLGNVKNNIVYVATNMDSISKLKNNIINDYMVGNHIKTQHEEPLKSFYLLNSKKLLVVDSLGIYNIKTWKPDYVLLRQSPKINLNRLIDSIKPKHIIADGSNYKTYITRWETTCKKRKIPFDQTNKNGAFILNY